MGMTYMGCLTLMWMICIISPLLRPLIQVVFTILFAGGTALFSGGSGSSDTNTKSEVGIAFIGGLDE